jgi:hypothetical protein
MTLADYVSNNMAARKDSKESIHQTTNKPLKSNQPTNQSQVDKVDTFVQKVGDDLGVLDEYRYEWRRLQTFNDWPHDSPRPSEMAKAGFFYSPIPEEPDRCPAHL